MVLALTLRSLTSTLFPQRTMGMFSQTRTRSPVLNFLLVSASQGLGSGFKLTMPVGDVLVGDSGCDIEHDDTALAVDVVAIS